MSLFVEERGSNIIPPLAEDSYPAVCVAVIDMGEQYSQAYEKWSRKVGIGWEIIGETVTIDGQSVPRTFYTTYTASLSSKGTLRKDLVSWRGRDFTPEELRRFDLRNILGKPCFLQIVHKKSPDGSRVYMNLAAVTKIPRGYPAPQATLPLLTYDIDQDDPAVLAQVPDWIAQKVRDSRTFEAKMDDLDADRKAAPEQELEKPELTELPGDEVELPF